LKYIQDRKQLMATGITGKACRQELGMQNNIQNTCSQLSVFSWRLMAHCGQKSDPIIWDDVLLLTHTLSFIKTLFKMVKSDFLVLICP
jgi:hypothetical protein